MEHAPAGSRKLGIALGATAAVALLELAGGLLSGSLALLSDAAHVAMDVVALSIALWANLSLHRSPNARQTFGFARMEMLGALANGVLLIAVTGFIAFEAIRRFIRPEAPEGVVMASFAGAAFAVNLAIAAMLVRDAHANLNLRGALLHVAGDVLGGLAVTAGGLIIIFTHSAWVDPAISLFVAAIILFGVYNLMRDATHVLLESAPAHAETPLVRDRLRAIDGVVDVHDLHVWTIGSGNHALAAHVLLNDTRISEATALLRQIETVLRADFGITHVTVQFECDNCTEDDRIVCTQESRRTAAHPVAPH